MLYYVKPRLKRLKQLNIPILPGFSSKCLNETFFQDDTSGSFVSSYFEDLMDKQMLKYSFMLKENCLKKYLLDFGFTNKRYLNIINLRMDVVLVKLGYFNTIKQSRQAIKHGHILVNFKLVKSFNFFIKRGDVISVLFIKKGVYNEMKKNFFDNVLKKEYFNSIVVSKDYFLLIVVDVIDLYYNFVSYDLSSVYRYYFV